MYFDAALPNFVDLALRVFGAEVFKGNSFVLRDVTGRLLLVLNENVAAEHIEEFYKRAQSELGEYVDFPVATPEELLDPDLANPEQSGGVWETVTLPSGDVCSLRLIDRRIVGEDWTTPNFSAVSSVPLATFFSCKGGVGRSTALAVAACEFARLHKNVLVLDFDLEAPGLGSIFLKPDEFPDFGALDYFVENGLANEKALEILLNNCVAPSPLTGGNGLVQVVPAVGRLGRDNPQNVLLKLGRAFLVDPDGAGGTLSFMQQTRNLIRALTERERYDVILVDARAGMSESAAASVLGLGGLVLLFGVDTPQTFESYSYLFAHLSRYATSSYPWRENLRMVHAKAGRGEEARMRFRDQAYDLFESYLYEEESAPDDFDAFNFDYDDEDAPHYAWAIPYDAEYAEFAPIKHSRQVSKDFYDRSFDPFFSRLKDTVFTPGDILNER